MSTRARDYGRVNTSFSRDEALLLKRVLGAASEFATDPAFAAISAKADRLVERADGFRKGVTRAAARARHERITADFHASIRQRQPWDSKQYAERMGFSYHTVVEVVRDARLVTGLKGVHLAKRSTGKPMLVAGIYGTLRDANQWGPWQLQPVAALVGSDVEQVRVAVKAAARRYPECARYEGGLTALLRDLRNVEYRARNEEAAE